MGRPDRLRRLVGLVMAAFVFGAVASPGVSAQTEEAPDVEQFGGYIASARSNALQITYDSPNLLPTGSPILQFSVPEALATLNSGPVGYALASFLFPGPLIADLDAALSQGGTATGIPPYPIRAEAFFPSGPTEASQGESGTEMVAETGFADSRASAAYAGLSLDPVGFLGAASSRSQSVIENEQVVARTRTELTDLSILGGLVHIESVVTDVVATSNGTDSASAGGTEVTGVTVLGLPATIDENGISFDERPGGGGHNPLGGLAELFGPVGDQVGGPLSQLAGPLNELFAQVDAAAEEGLQQLFEASGIDIRVLQPASGSDGGTATRTSSGLSITLNYDGQNTPLLSDLVALIPSSALPAENLGPIPFSPQALAKLLERIHSISIVVAPGDVSASATEAFVFEAPSVPATSPAATPRTTPASSAPGPSGDFATLPPDLPPPADPQVIEPLPVSEETVFPFGNALPALAVIALVASAPLFAAGSSRLADNTLAAVGTSCPDGLDRAPTEESRP